MCVKGLFRHLCHKELRQTPSHQQATQAVDLMKANLLIFLYSPHLHSIFLCDFETKYLKFKNVLKISQKSGIPVVFRIIGLLLFFDKSCRTP